MGKDRSNDTVDAVTAPTPLAPSDSRGKEYARLRALDLDDLDVKAKQAKMPVGKIGDLTVGRLISGSNLISMNMHATGPGLRDEPGRHYNTEERVFMTLKKCEEWGVNSIVLKDHNFKQFRLVQTTGASGAAKCSGIADVITHGHQPITNDCCCRAPGTRCQCGLPVGRSQRHLVPPGKTGQYHQGL